MDDEAFARMVQQQLLDEERMLMEQEQRWLQQVQQQQQHESIQEPDFDSQSYTRLLQEQGFNKPNDDMEGATRMSAPPRGYRIGGGAQHHHQPQPTQQQMMPPSPPVRPPANDFLDSDEELARRMQELETMGYEQDESFGAALQPSSSPVHQSNNNSYSNSETTNNPALGGRDWRREQEEEDARLARLLASQGDSFNGMVEPEIPPYPNIAESARPTEITLPSSRTTSYQPDFPSYSHEAALRQSEAFASGIGTRNDQRIPPSTRNENAERPLSTVSLTRTEYTERPSAPRTEFAGRAASHEPIMPQYAGAGDQGGNRGVPSRSHYFDDGSSFELVVPSFGNDSVPRQHQAVPSRPMSDGRAHILHARHNPDQAPSYEPDTSRDGSGPFHPEAATPSRQIKPPPPPSPDFNSARQTSNYGVAHSDYVDSSSRPSSQEFQPHLSGHSPQFSRQPNHPQTQQTTRTNSSGGALPNVNPTNARSSQGIFSNSPMTPTFRDAGLSRNGTVPPGRKRFDPNPLDQGPLLDPAIAGPFSPHPRGGYNMSPSASASRGPNPLDRGPLEGMHAAAKPPMISAGRRGSTDGSIEDPVSLLPGDAFLDVPVPVKKDKKKKGIMGKFFGGRAGGKETASVKSQSAAAYTNPNAFSGERGTLEQPGRSLSNQSDDTGQNAVMRFRIPPPVPRPADTIGAPKGPLPYSVSVCRQAPTLPEATVGRKPQLALTRGTVTCSVCGHAAQNPLNALDKKYHNDCFRCVTCHERIDPSGAFAFIETNGEKQPMHRKCYSEIFGIKCVVCFQSIPAGPDGKISFVKHPFFDTEQMCPRHARNMTRRCTGCHRFEPENEPFADLNDEGRCVCLACCRSVIVDSDDAQPLWTEVVDFFEHQLNMPIWKDFREIPILIVGYKALNDQMNSTCNVHGGSSQIMTRGLCLTEHESGRRFRMDRLKFDNSAQTFIAVDAEERGFTFFQVPDASKVNPDASVTAILCLSGLPRDLCASVLAHEATHAWIKLHPRFDFERPIPPQVEEGCAQLIAHLFLEGLDPPVPLDNNDGTGPSDEKLRQYFKFSIETDDHEIYGTGYRRAAMAYSNIGIEALMSHVVLYQDFPET